MRFATPRRFGPAEGVSDRPLPGPRPRGDRVSWWRWGSVAVVLAACPVGQNGPPDPPDAPRVEARPEWLRWYGQVAACVGRPGDPARVRWHLVTPTNEGRFFWWANIRVAGLWVEPHRIYLSAALAGDSVLVMHESLHDILQTGHHPDAFTRCGVRYPVLVEIP